MQQPLHPMTPMAPISTANITTEQIQRYLDENKQLILAILENQNLGKLAECAQYQALLQRNLLYLAAIADAQPQAHAARPQMMPQGGMVQGGQYTQQAPIFPPRAPLQFPQEQQQLHQAQAMPFPGQMGMRPGAMHAQPSHGGNADLHPAPSLAKGRAADGQGSKQDAGGAASKPAAAADGQRSSAAAAEQGTRDSDQSRAGRPED